MDHIMLGILIGIAASVPACIALVIALRVRPQPDEAPPQVRIIEVIDARRQLTDGNR